MKMTLFISASDKSLTCLLVWGNFLQLTFTKLFLGSLPSPILAMCYLSFQSRKLKFISSALKIEIVECRFCYRYGTCKTLSHFILLASRPPVTRRLQKCLRLCQTSNLVKVLKFMILMDGMNRFRSSWRVWKLLRFYCWYRWWCLVFVLSLGK